MILIVKITTNIYVGTRTTETHGFVWFGLKNGAVDTHRRCLNDRDNVTVQTHLIKIGTPPAGEHFIPVKVSDVNAAVFDWVNIG